jgi:hypothetical protein
MITIFADFSQLSANIGVLLYKTNGMMIHVCHEIAKFGVRMAKYFPSVFVEKTQHLPLHCKNQKDCLKSVSSENNSIRIFRFRSRPDADFGRGGRNDLHVRNLLRKVSVVVLAHLHGDAPRDLLRHLGPIR